MRVREDTEDLRSREISEGHQVGDGGRHYWNVEAISELTFIQEKDPFRKHQLLVRPRRVNRSQNATNTHAVRHTSPIQSPTTVLSQEE